MFVILKGDNIKVKKLLFVMILFTLLASGFAAASTLVKLEIRILALGMEETISVKLSEEFNLNEKIQQKAVITDYEDFVYENLTVQMSEIREVDGKPAAELMVSAIKSGSPFSLDFSGIRAGDEETCFGVSIMLLDFVSEGDAYVGARFVVNRQPEKWTDWFVGLIRQIIFG